MTDDRAVIQYDPSRADLAVEAAAQQLAHDRNLYQRAGALAFVTRVTAEDAERHAFLREEAPRVHVMSSPTLFERLCALVRFEVRGRRDAWVTKPPPGAVVAGILARRSWPGVPTLRGILETPTILPLSQRAELVTRPGYDRALGYLYLPPHGVTFPDVWTAPTRDDAVAALGALEDVFVDFPFERPEGRSVAIAAALTMIARPAIEGPTPVFAFDATTQGTGKSLCVDAVHVIATGRTAAKRSMPKDRAAGDDAELRKILDTVALVGAASVTLDNLAPDTPLGGPALEAIVTTGHHEGRILGRSEDFRVPWNTVVFVTGNNLGATADMHRRTLVARLASPYEKPEHRPPDSYAHPERAGVARFIAWLRGERPRLVHAALTLLRAFAVAGAPRRVATTDSFDAWAELIASAIVWAGGADPLACLLSAHEAEERPDVAALRVILRDLPRLDERGRGVSVKEMLALLYRPERVRGELGPPDGFDDLRDALEVLAPPRRSGGVPEPRELGNALAAVRGRILGGAALAHAPTGAKGSVARWIVRAGGAPIVATAAA